MMNDKLSNLSFEKFNNWLKQCIDLKSLNVVRQRSTNLMHSFEVIRKLEEFTKNKDLIFYI